MPLIDSGKHFWESKIGFGYSQMIILATVLIGSWNLAGNVNSRPQLPTFNNQPRTVRPLFNYPFVISDDQLSVVLEKLHPKFSDTPTKVNFVDHAIRLWGTEVEFQDGAYSGQQMHSLLLNHDAFAAAWGTSSAPLLKHTTNGISVTTQEGRASVSHVDHLMGTLAEIGTPLSTQIKTSRGTGFVKDVLVDALKNFRLNQREYEWTALSAAFYVADGENWYSSEGQLVNFDALAKRIMRQQQPQGVCYGQHRLYSLTILLRIDEQIRTEEGGMGLLTATTRTKIESYLFDMTRRFFKNQSLEGYWDGNWPDLSRAVPDPETDALSRRILATGHALEWWAMAPASLHPPRETIVRGAQWLTKTISEMDDHVVEKNYTFLTHAARSLALWRGCFAAEFEQQTIAENSAPQSEHAQKTITDVKLVERDHVIKAS